MLLISYLPAQTKRAFLVGIDIYQPKETPPPNCRKEWANLGGCVNDVQTVKGLLLSSLFRFKEQDIHVLTNENATRDRIISGIRKHLIDDAQAGDICLFYYAGHGSRVKNTLSLEPDKMDETLVPADWYRGGPDIRDKELKKLFNKVLDKTPHLTVIFDSCHSGSLSRGIPRSVRHRSMPPAPSPIAQPPEPQKSPAQRGALILSAAQDFQSAVEIKDENGLSRGLFTWALTKVLHNTPGNIPAQEMILKVKALMQSEGHFQEPNMEGLPRLTRNPILGRKANSPPLPLRFAVSRVVEERFLIQILGGLAVGIREGCILKKVHEGEKENQSQPIVRVRVTSLHGLNRCTAKVMEGKIQSIKSGDLFQIQKSVIARETRLKVYAPKSNIPHSQLIATAREMAQLCNMFHIPSVEDPTETNPTHIISWRKKGWQIQVTHNQTFLPYLFPEIKQPSAIYLLIAIFESHNNPQTKPRVFLQLPLSKELTQTLNLELHDNRQSVESSLSAADSHYHLIGRYSKGKIHYAWVLPNTTSKEKGKGVLPARTRWFAPGLKETPFRQCAEKLSDDILRLVKVRAWMQLSSPFPGDSFPYRLALKHAATRETTTTGPLVEGEIYGLTLTAEKKELENKNIQQRYIYVFSIDSRGKGTLLFPHRIYRNTGNFFPVDKTSPAAPIQLGRERIFKIAPPFGSDTFILLSTTDPLSNPLVLDFDGVYEKKPGVPLTPLETLLTDLRTGMRKKSRYLVPINWSVQRLPVASRPQRNADNTRSENETK